MIVMMMMLVMSWRKINQLRNYEPLIRPSVQLFSSNIKQKMYINLFLLYSDFISNY